VKLFPAAVLLLLLLVAGQAASGSMIPGSVEGALSPPMSSCAPEEYESAPCRCCKMGCWYTVARSATHELGHIPGQDGEEEALATLKLIRACMITECTPLCPAKKRSAGAMFPGVPSPKGARPLLRPLGTVTIVE